MDFLDLWRNYPVLWHDSPTLADTVYAAAADELTKEINSKRNLTITNTGMTLTLNRIRCWFQHYKSEKKISDDGRNIYNQYIYHEKCSKFLSKHETRTVACDKCQRLFIDKAHLQEHEIKKHKTFCDICQKDYVHSLAYRKHTIIHQPATFECNICGKKYIRFEHHRDHMRAHRNERNFVCEKCGKGFVRQKNLKEHKLQKHSDRKNNLKRVVCAICDHDFSNNSGLSLHRKRCHLVLEGTIEDLESRGKRGAREKRKHTFIVDSVTKQQRTVCDICGNTYARHGGLLVHMAKEHGFVRAAQRQTKALESQKGDLNGIQLNTGKTAHAHNSNEMVTNAEDDERNLSHEDETVENGSDYGDAGILLY